MNVVRAEVINRGLCRPASGSSLSVIRKTRFVANFGALGPSYLTCRSDKKSTYPSRRTQLQLVNKSPTGMCLSVGGYSSLRRFGLSRASEGGDQGVITGESWPRQTVDELIEIKNLGCIDDGRRLVQVCSLFDLRAGSALVPTSLQSPYCWETCE